MLNRIISWSLGHRLIVILAWGGIALAGVVAFAGLPLDAFPDTTPVQVQVNAAAPAYSPLEIERRITIPVEQAISGLPGLTEVRSLSRSGISQVTAMFEDGTDIWLARQVVMERLQGVDLPDGIARPSLGPVATGLGEIFHYLVSAAGRSLADLRTLHDRVVKPRLASVPGVAEVNTWGGEERQFQIVVDPAELAARGLSLDQLAGAVEAGNLSAAGGILERAGESSFVQGVATVAGLDDLGKIVIASRDGVAVRIGDVARLVEGAESRHGAVTSGGRGEVVLGLAFLLMGENARDVAGRLRIRLDEVRKSLPEGVEVAVAYDRTTLVDEVLRTVRKNLFEGAVLVVAVLFIFLGNLRAGLIVASGIPLSMLLAFDLMSRAGIAGSLMSLGAIDFGLIVDSSVIMIENAVHRLGADTSGRTRLEIVREAAVEVRKPTMFGELIIMAVYLPILFLQGMEGKLFRPMALTVVFALAGSMVLSLTLMPALASFLPARRHTNRENILVRGIKRIYLPVLEWSLGHRAAVLGATLALVAGAGFLAPRLGSEFIPRLKEGSIVINTVRLASVSLAESVRYGTRIEQRLLAEFPREIGRVWTRTGSAEVATDPMGVELSDVFITLTPPGSWTRAGSQDELVAEMQRRLATLPGMKMIFTQPIEMRVNEMVAGIRSDLGVKVFGDDFEVLREKSGEVEAILKGVPGAADVTTEQLTGQPLVRVEVDREAVARHGLSAREVLRVVEALGSVEVGQVQQGEIRFPIALRLGDRFRGGAEALGKALVTGPGGLAIPLERLARITTAEGPSSVNREWGRRRVTVQANVRGRDVGSFVAEASRRIGEEVALPDGYYIRFGGQFEHLERANRRLLLVVPAALMLILFLLYLTYGNLLDSLRVFTGVPFAAVGGVAALWLRDMPFSVSAGVGFVALSGVSVLGDMVLVSTIRRFLAQNMPLRSSIIGAAERRVRPVLMTALVASLGFVPMAFNTGLGAEVQRPLATVVIGGVISSTLLTLVILPVIYSFTARQPFSVGRRASQPCPPEAGI